MINNTLLKNIHQDKDIYVLGSGPSMQYIDKNFFDGKITIGANLIYKYFPVMYLVFKHSQFIEDAKGNGIIIASKHDCGDINHPETRNNNVNYFFTHKCGRFGDIDKNFDENINSIGNDDDIFVSYSTITSCIHLAAYMGARNIIICGHDCGWLDDNSHVEDYGDRIVDVYETVEKFNKYYNDWFDRINSDSIKLKEKLIEVYGCNIYSLNPFINFRMEGHTYDTEK